MRRPTCEIPVSGTSGYTVLPFVANDRRATVVSRRGAGNDASEGIHHLRHPAAWCRAHARARAGRVPDCPLQLELHTTICALCPGLGGLRLRHRGVCAWCDARLVIRRHVGKAVVHVLNRQPVGEDAPALEVGQACNVRPVPRAVFVGARARALTLTCVRIWMWVRMPVAPIHVRCAGTPVPRAEGERICAVAIGVPPRRQPAAGPSAQRDREPCGRSSGRSPANENTHTRGPAKQGVWDTPNVVWRRDQGRFAHA